jgi:hypothetical protein
LFLLKEQRLLEQEAAIICIQSVWRSKNTRKKHFLSQLNLKIAKFQAIWKSFQTRRFLRRQKRYQKILFVTIQIQIQWRFRQRHRFFVYQFQLNRASKIITKSIRQYVSKCQMLKQAMVHLTRSHAATLIQMWMRRCFVSKRCHQRLCIRQIKAQRILRRFFCRIQLFKLFEKRFLMMLKKKTEKAIKIQALYRIRKAKIRFNLLKDQLEAHKKQEMIRLLWQNTYATRIQTWWKRNSNRNRRLLLDTLNQ